MTLRRAIFLGLIGALVIPQVGPTMAHVDAQRAHSCPFYQATDTWYTSEHNPSNYSQVDQVSNKTTYYYTSGCGSANKSFYGSGISDAFSQTAQWASLRFNIANIVVGVGSLDHAPTSGPECATLPTTASFNGNTTNPGSNTIYQQTSWGNYGAVGCATFDTPTYTYAHQPS